MTDLRIKIVCSSCGYFAGECTAVIRDFVCRFCVSEAQFLIDWFTIGPGSADKYETLTENSEQDWNRHREMMDTKDKISQFYWSLEL